MSRCSTPDPTGLRSLPRRLVALQRACALGGVSLALLAPAVQAQTARPDGRADGGARRAARLDAARRDARLGAPVRRIDAAGAGHAAGGGGAPTFAAPVTPAGLTDIGTRSTPSVADLDGDGDVDVLAGEIGGTFVYFENTAGPGAAPAFTLAATPAGLTDVGDHSTPSVADLDGDGDADVLTGEYDGVFTYFENTTGPGAAPAFTLAATPAGLADVAFYSTPSVTDLDGDGDVDVLSGELGGTFFYFENTTGPGAAPAFTLAATPAGFIDIEYSSTPSVADLDGDGDVDVLAGESNGAFVYFENTAGPGAAPAFTLAATPAGLTDVGERSAPAVADLDGDGDFDVLSGEVNGTFVYFENTQPGSGTLTARLTGTDGYRMLAAPSPATSIADLLGPTIYTQGFPGATDDRGGATVYRYDEAAPGSQNNGYAEPANASDPVGLGQGLFVQLFADEDPRPSAPGQQGGFPKTLAATGRPDLIEFDWGPGGDAPLSYTNSGTPDGDGWNLLGNPFGSWFDWDGVDLTGVNAPVYVYDNAVAAYRSHTRGIPNAGNLNGGVIGPFQGFWAHANAASPAITARPAVSSGGPLLRGGEASAVTVVGLRLRPGAGSALPPAVRSEAFLALGVDGAEAGVSPLDAFALVPPSASYVLLATEAEAADGGAALLAIDARPAPEGVATVELDVSAVLNGAAVGSALVLDWPGLSLPAGWAARLLDRETGAVVDLGAATEYAFTLAGAAAVETPEVDVLAAALAPTGGPRVAARTTGRFALEVTPSGVVAGEGGAAAVLSLSAVRPNPTTGAAALTLTLAEAGAARVSVVDVLGREVSVLVDGALGAGPHVVRVAPGTLAAGTYVVRAAVGGRVLTQRLTVTR